MNYLQFEILELLIKYESLAPREVVDLLGISYTAADKAFKELHEKRVIRYDIPIKTRRTINKEHPFVLKFREFLAVDSEYKNKLSIITKKSSKDIIHCFSGDRILTRNDLAKKTGFSLKTVRKVLNELLDADIVQEIGGWPVKYGVRRGAKNRLFLDLIGLMINGWVKEPEKPMSYKELIRRLIVNDQVYVLIHYGSTQFSLDDDKSDIDLFLVASDRETLHEIRSLSFDPRIELNPILIEKIKEFAKREPEFVSQLMSGKVLKGRHILEALAEN